MTRRRPTSGLHMGRVTIAPRRVAALIDEVGDLFDAGADDADPAVIAAVIAAMRRDQP